MERFSSIKSKNATTGSQNAWLAVFPLELHFTSPLDFDTVLYFQKNYQILGDYKTVIPPHEINKRYIFTSIDHLTTFKMISALNTGYKWSLYRRYDSGQQEFIQSFPFDFKTLITDQLTAIRSSIYGSISSLALSSIVQRQLTAAFSNGVKLRFLFFATDDLKAAEESIQIKVTALKAKQAEQEIQVHQQTPLPAEGRNSEANIEVSSKVDTDQPLKEPSSIPDPPNSVPEETPKEEDKVVEEVLDSKKAEQQNVSSPEPPQLTKSTDTCTESPISAKEKLQIDKDSSLIDIDLLKLESHNDPLRQTEKEKEPNEDIQAISEEPQIPQQSTEENPYNAEVEQIPVTQTQKKGSGLESALKMQIDLKKVIILLVVVVVGMGVLLWPKTAAKGKKGKGKRK